MIRRCSRQGGRQAGRRTEHARSRKKQAGKRRQYPGSRRQEAGSSRQQTEIRRQQVSVLIGRETVWPPVLTMRKQVHHKQFTVQQIKGPK